MKSINTSSLLICNAVSLCTNVIEMLQVTQSKMQQKYENAKDEWADSKYQQLGEIFNECFSSISKTLHELNDCLGSLNEIKQNVAEYEGINLFGNIPTYGSGHQPIQVGIAGVFGGSYRDCKKSSTGLSGFEEVHHIPAKCISNLSISDGPSIIMSKKDHSKTASYDNKKGAKEYCEKQYILIKQGKFKEAMQMDIDDIHFKFGDKYDKGIAVAILYLEQLISKEKI